MAYDAALAARVRRLLDKRGGAGEVAMMGGLCFLRGGNMCCGVTGARLMVRLGPAGAAAALADPEVALLTIGGGRTAGGFVTVAAGAVADDAALAAWLGRGLAFTDALPPKPPAQRRR